MDSVNLEHHNGQVKTEGRNVILGENSTQIANLHHIDNRLSSFTGNTDIKCTTTTTT
jgi:hypothetical protein